MGLEWLLSVQEPGGGFHNTTCQERYGPYAVLLYLRASAGYPERQRAIRRELRLRAEEVRREGERHPFGWAGRGALAAGFQRTAGFSAQSCLTASR